MERMAAQRHKGSGIAVYVQRVSKFSSYGERAMKHSRIRFFSFFVLLVASISAGLAVLVTRRETVNRVPLIRPFDIAKSSLVDIASQSEMTTKTIVVKQPDHKAAKLLHSNLTRYGAWAEVNCHVSDRFGNPLPDADVHFYFDTH